MKKSINLNLFFENTLKGIAQVMLQNNKWTGWFFLLGLFVGHWKFGLVALVSSSIGTLTAYIIKCKNEDINAGLYGFSATLVGIGMLFLFQSNWLIWLLIVFGSVWATFLQAFFIKRKIPVYTFPFILITWVLYFILNRFSLADTPAVTEELQSTTLWFYGFKGIGQVMFQDHLWVGVLFFVGIFIQSKRAAVIALIAAYASGYIAFLLGQPMDMLEYGILSFNAVLSAVAFVDARKDNVIWILVAIIITTLINVFLLASDLLAPFGGVLTFAFVLGTWITLLLRKLYDRNTSIPFNA